MELKFDQNINLHLPFLTPVATFILPNAEEIGKVLESAILLREAEDRGLNRSNQGGWHSASDLLEWPEVVALDFEDSLASAVRHIISYDSRCKSFDAELRLHAWANVNRAGDYNALHTHPNNHWSGVYYVTAGEYTDERNSHAACIELIDPRGGVNSFKYPGHNQFGSSVKFAPQAGMLVLFPSWLQHCVSPFTSQTVRISVGFNAKIESFEDRTDAVERMIGKKS